MLKNWRLAPLPLALLACSQATRECYDLVPQDGIDVVHWKSNSGNSTLLAHAGSDGYFVVNAAPGSREVILQIAIDATGHGRPLRYDRTDELPYLDCAYTSVSVDGSTVRPSNKGACANGVSREQMPDVQTMAIYFELPQPAEKTLKIRLPQLRKKDARQGPVVTVDYAIKSFPVNRGGLR